jgi:hypothetical protein
MKNISERTEESGFLLEIRRESFFRADENKLSITNMVNKLSNNDNQKEITEVAGIVPGKQPGDPIKKSRWVVEFKSKQNGQPSENSKISGRSGQPAKSIKPLPVVPPRESDRLAELKRRNFEKANARFQKPAGTSSVANSQQNVQDAQTRKNEVNNAIKEKQKLNDRIQARRERLNSEIRNRITNKLSMKRQRAELDAVSITFIIFAFFIALAADSLEIVCSITGVGIAFCPFMGFVASILVGILWWFVGAGDFSGRLKKVGKRTGITLIAESIPVIDLLPGLTCECILNLLDFVGAFDNKVGAQVKRVIS